MENCRGNTPRSLTLTGNGAHGERKSLDEGEPGFGRREAGGQGHQDGRNPQDRHCCQTRVNGNATEEFRPLESCSYLPPSYGDEAV